MAVRSRMSGPISTGRCGGALRQGHREVVLMMLETDGSITVVGGR